VDRDVHDAQRLLVLSVALLLCTPRFRIDSVNESSNNVVSEMVDAS